MLVIINNQLSLPYSDDSSFSDSYSPLSVMGTSAILFASSEFFVYYCVAVLFQMRPERIPPFSKALFFSSSSVSSTLKPGGKGRAELLPGKGDDNRSSKSSVSIQLLKSGISNFCYSVSLSKFKLMSLSKSPKISDGNIAADILLLIVSLLLFMSGSVIVSVSNNSKSFTLETKPQFYVFRSSMQACSSRS